MKRLQDLDKIELLSLITNNLNIKNKTPVECAICGKNNVQYYYICNNCKELSKD